jgi:hypothetical protein
MEVAVKKNGRKRWLIVLIVIAAVCFAPGAVLRWKIGQSVEAKMPELIGPARSYSVAVSGGLFEIIRGRIDKLDICANDVKLPNGLVLDQLDADLKGIRFKPDQTVTDVKTTDFAAIVTEKNLSDFLEGTRSDMRGAKVSLDGGKLCLSASPRVFAARTPVSIEGTLKIVNGSRLNLVLNRCVARGICVPGFIKGRIMHDLNPVLDTEQMGIGAKLNSVEISNGAITVTGKADLKQALAK